MSLNVGLRSLRRVITISASGATVLTVIALAVSWFEMTPAERSGIYGLIGKAIAWVGIVILLPWATYFASSVAARRDSNLAGLFLIAGYTFVDVLALILMFGVSRASSVHLAAIVVGLLAAVVYNLLVCDWIAEKQ